MRHNVRQTTRQTTGPSEGVFGLADRITTNAETIARLLNIAPTMPVREADLRRSLARILSEYGSAMIAELESL